MADQSTSLAIVIEAINKASADLKQVQKDLTGLSDTVEEQGTTATTAAIGFGELVAGVTLGGAGAIIAADAFRKLTSVLVDIPKSLYSIALGASEVEGLGIAMHVVANNAGITAEAVDKVRDSVVDQNVTTQAANRLMTDLIRNQLDYTQATDLATAAQNIAVASGVSSSETIERLSIAISTGNTWMLRQLGLVEHLDAIYEKYGATLGKTSEQMTEVERKQAVANYFLQEGEKYAGAYGQAMLNAAKKIRSTQDRIKEISYSLGKIFGPALYELTDMVYDFVNSIVKWAHENEEKLRAIAKSVGEFTRGVVEAMKTFVKSIPWDTLLQVLNYVIRATVQFGSALKIAFNSIQIFTRGVQIAINSVVQMGRALWALIRRDWRALEQAFLDAANYMVDTASGIVGDIEDIGNALKTAQENQKFNLKDWWRDIKALDEKGWEDRLKEAEEGGRKMTAKQQKAMKKMLEDLEKENRKYQKAVEKRAKQFEESFDDLVLRHRDSIKDLTEDLEEETKDYQEKIADMAEDYTEAMEEMKDRHKRKTESILEDMEDERKRAEEEIEKITEKYNEQKVLLEREGEARLSDLKAQLDREVALGDNANKDKISALEQMIAYEKKGLATSLDEKKAKHDEEVADIEEKLSDKLAKIQKELDEEDTLYTKAFDKRKKQHDEDVADAKESYEEKRQSLQEELDKETAIREKYADDFARLADKIAEDDLTRLVRKHGEELQEMKENHDERIAEIRKKAFSEGRGFTEGFAEGFDSGYPQVKNRLNQMEGDMDRVTGSIRNLTNEYNKFNRLYSSGGGFGGGGGGGWGTDWRIRAQYGGVFSKPTIVGEAGAEVVLPLNFPKRMAQIMKSLGIGGQGGGQVTQNFYVTVNDRQSVDVLMERAGFALKQGGI